VGVGAQRRAGRRRSARWAGRRHGLARRERSGIEIRGGTAWVVMQALVPVPSDPAVQQRDPVPPIGVRRGQHRPAPRAGAKGAAAWLLLILPCLPLPPCPWRQRRRRPGPPIRDGSCGGCYGGGGGVSQGHRDRCPGCWIWCPLGWGTRLVVIGDSGECRASDDLDLTCSGVTRAVEPGLSLRVAQSRRGWQPM
jgi:hypothetical protein